MAPSLSSLRPMVDRRHRQRAHADDNRPLMDEEVGTMVRSGLRQILIARDDAEHEAEARRFIEEEGDVL